MTINNKLI